MQTHKHFRFTAQVVFLLLATSGVFSTTGANEEPVERKFINPANGYTQVVAIEANGITTLYTSGQVSEGETIEDQLRGTFAALKKQLADAGAGLSDIVKMNTYIVNYNQSHLDTFREVRNEFFPAESRPASTLVGVTALALPKYLVEIEAVAVLPTDN